MAIPVGIVTLVTTIGGLVADWFKRKQELTQTKHEAEIARIKAQQEQDHEWEMRQLDQAGWKDDILFYAVIGFFVWSGFAPEKAKEILTAWESLPDWFLEITFWLVAAVLGVKTIGKRLPGVLRGTSQAVSVGVQAGKAVAEAKKEKKRLTDVMTGKADK